jgi:hypothetical protein
MRPPNYLISRRGPRHGATQPQVGGGEWRLDHSRGLVAAIIGGRITGYRRPRARCPARSRRGRSRSTHVAMRPDRRSALKCFCDVVAV